VPEELFAFVPPEGASQMEFPSSLPGNPSGPSGNAEKER
jgi:hypothetical protein